MCCRPQNPRPSQSLLPWNKAWPGLTLPVHSFWIWGCLPRALPPKPRGRSATEGSCPATTPDQSPGPAAIPARPRPPPGGGLKDCGGPRPTPEPRNSTLHQGTGQTPPARKGPLRSPRSPPPSCPTAAGSLPGAPSPAPDFPRHRDQTLSVLPRASQRGSRAGGSEGPRRPIHWAGKNRAGSRRPAWEVTLIILRGSPAILSDPDFGLWFRLRLRSPHARVEVPGSTSGGRCRARRSRRHRGPLGNVVPAPLRLASFGLGPLPGPPHPSPGREVAEVTRGGGGGSWGGGRRGAAQSSGARELACLATVGLGSPCPARL